MKFYFRVDFEKLNEMGCCFWISTSISALCESLEDDGIAASDIVSIKRLKRRPCGVIILGE